MVNNERRNQMKLKIGNEIVYYQKSNKFKNIILGIYMAAPFDLKYKMEWPILARLLDKTNGLYKTEEEYQNYCYDNYGLSISVDTYFLGKSYIFCYYVNFVNPKYLPEDIDLMKEAFSLLENTITNPDFTVEKLEVEKYNIKNSILNLQNNKQRYAFQEYMKLLCQGSITEHVLNKSIEELNKVTLDTLKEAYQKMLNFSRLCFISGDVKKVDVVDYFSHLSLPPQLYNYKKLVMYEKLPQRVGAPQVKIVDEIMESSILYVGYRVDEYYFDKDFFALVILSMILGGGSYSEAYKRIREEKGLIYYVDCSYDKRRGTISFVMEIDKNNYDIILEILNEIIKDFQTGQFDQTLLDKAFSEISNTIYKENDRISSICSVICDELDHFEPLTTQEILDKYLATTKDDIISVANKMRLDTIYFLRGDQ